MASRASKTARTRAKGAAKDLRQLIEGVGVAARKVAKKHGATRSVTIVKGRTISKDKPTKVTVIKKR